jgi:hypothetical protein
LALMAASGSAPSPGSGIRHGAAHETAGLPPSVIGVAR